ncbi:hypothetical protein LTR36_004232 [Oleoguttula mirabilis]|uniref:Ribonuclease P/MRP protein subunit POP5 n=1 Tax=Oleoguttula mirabilis TaxID=1507867 RepID=A0AAV9JGV5_9PEZI|nr:hypothetical protein LTR36_004232 [Oleoguttula mirabilis]
MVRIKHRYLLLNILYPDQKTANVRIAGRPGEQDVPYSVQFRQPSSDQLTPQILLRIIRDGVATLFGDYGSGKVSSSLQIKYFSPATSTAIIRISRDHYRLVWAALSFVTRLPKPLDQPCVIQVVRVSGTIKKAEEEAIRRARISIRRAQRAGKGKDVVVAAASGVQAVEGADEDDDFGMMDGIEDHDAPGEAEEDSDEAG